MKVYDGHPPARSSLISTLCHFWVDDLLQRFGNFQAKVEKKKKVLKCLQNNPFKEHQRKVKKGRHALVDYINKSGQNAVM